MRESRRSSRGGGDVDEIEFEMAVDPRKGIDFDEDVIDELSEVLLWFFQIYFSFMYFVFSWHWGFSCIVHEHQFHMGVLVERI